MQNLPVSIFPSETENANLYASSALNSAEAEAFNKIFEEKRSIYEDDVNRDVEETATTLLNRMGNTLFSGGTRLLNRNIDAVTGLFSDTTLPRKSMAAVQGRLSSFIDPERMTYGGLPSDFDAFTVQNGTLSHDDMNLLKKTLKEKGAHEASLDVLNQLMASGSPLTLASAINKLTGQTRLHEELSDDERSIFRLLGNKAGINILEADHMLALSDSGNSKGLWNLFVGKLSSMESETIDLTKKEAETLLKSLDMSQSTRKLVLGQFTEDQDSITLSKEELNKFFSAVRNELTERDNAQRHCASILDAAVKDTLEQRKLADKTALQSNMRSDSSSERLETRMRQNILQKSGITDLADSTSEREDLSREFAEGHSDGHQGKVAYDAEAPITNRLHHTGNRTETQPAESAMPRKATVSPIPQQNSVEQTTERYSVVNEVRNPQNLARQHQQEIFQQIQSGLVQTYSTGTQEFTIQLNPKDLGQLSLIMTSREGELRATIRAENGETAAVVSEQLDALKTALEDQRITITELEVKTGLQNNTHQYSRQTPQASTLPHTTEKNAQQVAQFVAPSPHSLEINAQQNLVQNKHSQNLSQNQENFALKASVVLPAGGKKVITKDTAPVQNNNAGDRRNSAIQNTWSTPKGASTHTIPFMGSGTDKNVRTRNHIPQSFVEANESILATKEVVPNSLSTVRNELTGWNTTGHHTAPYGPFTLKDVEHGTQEAFRFHSQVQTNLTEQESSAMDVTENFFNKHSGIHKEHTTFVRGIGIQQTDINTGTLSANIPVVEKTALLTGTQPIDLQHLAENSFPPAESKNIQQLAQQHRQEIFQQVQSGFLRNHANGTTQLTLRLDPQDLGQLSLIMTSREGEIRATIRAENAETAAVLSEQMEHLKATLEEQGFKVAELEVKTGLHNEMNQHNWQGSHEHNQRYEAEQRARVKRLAQIRTDAPANGTVIVKNAHVSQDGLHIVA